VGVVELDTMAMSEEAWVVEGDMPPGAAFDLYVHERNTK
jgi:hypothetical protein